MLTIRFDPSAKWLDDRIKVDPPYKHVGLFIGSDIQASVQSATHFAKVLRDVLSGARAPIECAQGNAWLIDADREWTTLTNTYTTPPLEVRLHTSWLLDAVERWRQHLIDQGYPLDQ